MFFRHLSLQLYFLCQAEVAGERGGGEPADKQVSSICSVHPQNVRFQNVKFQNVRFQNVKFQNVRFQNVRFQNVRFQNVRFQNVRFQNVWNVRFTKCQVYETSGLQNVRFTKRQVFKTSGCKKTSINILYLWLVEIRRLCCSHVCRQSDGCVLFSIFEVFLSYITITDSNK
jgi:uncharacterized protein YjbI with pentapeptide repeats